MSLPVPPPLGSLIQFLPGFTGLEGTGTLIGIERVADGGTDFFIYVVSARSDLVIHDDTIVHQDSLGYYHLIKGEFTILSLPPRHPFFGEDQGNQEFFQKEGHQP